MHRKEQARAILAGDLIKELLDQYREGQVDSWLACNDWEKRHDYHAKCNAAIDFYHYMQNKALETINGNSE